VEGIWDSVNDLQLDAIVLSPSFSNAAADASQFPSLGEGAFLQQVTNQPKRAQAASDHPCKLLILLVGRAGFEPAAL
jgi:hypothetical protein